MRLGEILVRSGLITPQQLDQALQAQTVFGGRLGSNLVEMGVITEDQLAQCLGQQLGTPYVRPQVVAAIPREVIAKVPRDLVKKYRVIPLKVQGRDLHVGAADPADLARIDELSFALNCRVVPYVITEVSLNYALERYYGIRKPARGLALPSGPALPAFGVAQVSPREAPAALAPRSEARYGGPTSEDLALLREALASAMSEADVLETLFRFSVLLFDDVAVLSITGGAGGRARGAMVGTRHNRRPNAAGLDLSLPEAGVIGECVSRAQIAHRPQANDPALVRVCSVTKLEAYDLTVIPVADFKRPLFVIVGQGLDEPTLLTRFEVIRGFIGKVTYAFQILALRDEIRRPAG